MYYEFYRNNEFVARDDRVLGEIRSLERIGELSTVTITVPAEYTQALFGRAEMRIYFDDGCFFEGIVTGKTFHGDTKLLDVELIHKLDEWRRKEIPTNLSVKNMKIKDLYEKFDFGFDNGVNVEFLDDVGDREIEYVFSRQNKLEVLNVICELTPDVFWRVPFNSNALQYGTFQHPKKWIFTKDECNELMIPLIDEPDIREDFTDVVNRAVIYSEKTDNGATSMSLREVFNDDSLWNEGFPVVSTGAKINTESVYKYWDMPSYAPNTGLEFAVLDVEGYAMEGGYEFDGTYAFTDLQPMANDNDKITDDDRIKASKMAYDRACRRLIEARRHYEISFEPQDIPCDLQVGDKIKFKYTSTMSDYVSCDTNYLKKLLELDEWWVITDIERIYYGTSGGRITIDKFLRKEQ